MKSMQEKLLKIRLFGALSLTLDGNPISDLPTRKAEALLVYLASHRRTFSREVLADLLWDDRPQDQALANLRSILSSLRRTLDPYLHVTRQTVAFNHDSHYWLDVAEFERKAEELDQENGESQPATELLAETLDLYQGAFLEGFYLRDSLGFEEWALMERERLQCKAVALLWRLIDAQSMAGEYATGLRSVDRLLQFDNLSERAHRTKMQLLARTGQYNAALQHYEVCCQILAAELGVDPAPETQSLHEQIRTAREMRPPQLPPPPPHFLGRAQEQAHLLAQLDNPACRLLTLLAPSGMGKSRLALETARHLRLQRPGRFLHGVYFVSLVDLAQSSLLAPLLAEALGVSLSSQQTDPFQAVVDFLCPLELLLVLDNLEQLAGDLDWLVQILQEAPGVKVMVTSQSPLHLHEEWLVDLAGLSAPGEDEEVETEAAAEAYSAVHLFLQIARRLQPAYRPAPAEMRAIGHICRLLEGMPLGIELAAAWIRQFSPDQMAQEIGQGLDFLTTKMRNAPERHRSLRAAFTYAWQLLPPEVQPIFARLAVFHRGFSPQAAQSVAAAQPQHLALLVEKSLLRLEAGRYELHPMLTHFAGEQLALDEETRRIAAQTHAAFYFDFLADQGSGEEIAQRQAIQTEMPNLRAAWQWAIAQQDLPRLLRAAATLHNFYSVQSWFREGIDAFQHALDHLPAGPDNTPEQAQVRCELLGRKARMHIHIGQLAQARQALDEAQTQMHAIDDPARLSTITGYMAITAFHAGEIVRAIGLAEGCLALDEGRGDRDGAAFALSFLGSCYKTQGDYVRAADCFQRSVGLYAEIGDDLGRAMTLNNLGNLAQAQGEYEAAHDYYLTCSRLFEEQNHHHGTATTLANAGRLARKLGNLGEAAELLGRSLELKRSMADERGVAVALVGLADVAVAAGETTRARSYLHEALATSRRVGDVKLMLEGLAVWGALSRQTQAQAELGVGLLTFVLAHPALPQELRTQIEEDRAAIPPSAWQKAVAWAAQQELDALVQEIVAQG